MKLHFNGSLIGPSFNGHGSMCLIVTSNLNVLIAHGKNPFIFANPSDVASQTTLATRVEYNCKYRITKS